MKLIFAVLFVGVLSLTSMSTASAELIMFQGFETTETANYLTDPAQYNQSGGTDVWSVLTNQGLGGGGGALITASSGDSFFGIRDLGNNVGGGDFLHRLSFNSVDLSQATNVKVKVDYFIPNFDDDDSLVLMLNSIRIPLPDVGDWSTLTFNAPDTLDFINIGFEVNQDGEDWAGLDNIRVEGDLAPIPEPSTTAMFLTITSFLFVRRRKF